MTDNCWLQAQVVVAVSCCCCC